MFATIIVAILAVAAWDSIRRHINDNRAAREFRAEQATRLLQELHETSVYLKELKTYLEQRQKVQEQALINFIDQARDVVKFSEERRAEAQKSALGKAFGSQR